MNEANGLISRRALENFLMARIVNDETQLSKHKRQESGIAEFCPWIVKTLYQQESANEQNKVEQHLSAVIYRLLRQ